MNSNHNEILFIQNNINILKVKEIDELVKTRSKYITQEGTPFIFDFIKTIKNLTLIKLRLSN